MSFNTPTGGGGGTGGVLPNGVVTYLKDGVCVPAGWVEECRARGRYIVGLPSGGCAASTVGTALSNKECRPVGQHTHTVSVTDPGHVHSYTAISGSGCRNGNPHVSGTTNSSTTGLSATAANAGSVTGTPTPYIQFKAIRKCAVGSGCPPSGIIAYLKDLVCIPCGWVEECRARGRYIVGLPSGGCAASSIGTALSNKECRPVGQHTHTVSVSDPGHTHSYGGKGGATTICHSHTSASQPSRTICCSTGSATSCNTPGITASLTNTGSVVGTPAPYIQFKAVRKS